MKSLCVCQACGWRGRRERYLFTRPCPRCHLREVALPPTPPVPADVAVRLNALLQITAGLEHLVEREYLQLLVAYGLEETDAVIDALVSQGWQHCLDEEGSLGELWRASGDDDPTAPTGAAQDEESKP